MGPNPLILDHNLALELWNDPLFWESVPDWENFRDDAETAVAAAIASQSSLRLKVIPVYNRWVRLIRDRYDKEPYLLRQLTDYIHKQRKNRQEAIVLPPDKTYRESLILSEGVS
jgi:hypothetical protein